MPAARRTWKASISSPRCRKPPKKNCSRHAGDEPFAANRTYPIDRYVRCHQTSGTRGRPLVVLDTADDWQWWIDAWQYVLDAADVTPSDRALLAFSFGPFIGFWSAFDALVARGALVIPGGGLSSLARIELIRSANVTTLLLHAHLRAPARRSRGRKQHQSGRAVGRENHRRRRAGRQRACHARSASNRPGTPASFDHGGATEVGPWGFADADGRGLHVNEAHFLAEFISVETGQPAQEGELSHLILTTLGRTGAPVIRYRTGDLVRPVWPTTGGSQRRFVLLEGGILGRADDMMIIRGMNIYPTAIEQILHSFPEVVEYRITARKHGAMDELVVEVEDHLQQPARIAEELQLKLGLKIDVRCVSAMSLPRFEGKGQRFIDERQSKRWRRERERETSDA